MTLALRSHKARLAHVRMGDIRVLTADRRKMDRLTDEVFALEAKVMRLDQLTDRLAVNVVGRTNTMGVMYKLWLEHRAVLRDHYRGPLRSRLPPYMDAMARDRHVMILALQRKVRVTSWA